MENGILPNPGDTIIYCGDQNEDYSGTGGRKNGINPNPVAKMVYQMTKMKITLGLENGRTGSALIL